MSRSQRQFGAREFRPGHEQRRQGGVSHLDRRHRPTGGFDFAHQEVKARPDQPGVNSVGPIAVRANLRAVLESVTLADLAAGHLPDDVGEITSDPEAWQPH